MIRRPPRSTLFPYTRSSDLPEHDLGPVGRPEHGFGQLAAVRFGQDRKSTRLNSSHRTISYAVFCLKKKKICKHLDPFSTYHRVRLTISERLSLRIIWSVLLY